MQLTLPSGTKLLYSKFESFEYDIANKRIIFTMASGAMHYLPCETIEKYHHISDKLINAINVCESV